MCCVYVCVCLCVRVRELVCVLCLFTCAPGKKQTTCDLGAFYFRCMIFFLLCCILPLFFMSKINEGDRAVLGLVTVAACCAPTFVSECRACLCPSVFTCVA